MSIDLWFEADERLTEAGLMDLLLETGGFQFELENGPIGFSFDSGMNAFPSDQEGDSHIKAEDERSRYLFSGIQKAGTPQGTRFVGA